MKKLNEDFKSGKFEQVYLLYGEEGYLKKQYKKRFIKAMIPEGDTMNYAHYEGKNIPADVGGILMVVYDENGNLELKVDHKEDDFTFDEIGSVLKIKELQKTKEELFESLEMFYKVFYLGEDSDDI